MRNILNTLSAIGALAMAATPLLAIGSLAHAGEATVRPAFVQVSGLDLSRSADAATFRSRVDTAAIAIGSQDVVRTRTDETSCRDAVREEAVDGLGAGQRHALQTASSDGVRTWSVATR